MERPYVVVAGGVNVDICGKSDAPLRAGDSNPGRVRVSLGGVGRNIAHNLRVLGVETALLTALGGDGHSREIEKSCRALGIGVERCLRVPEGRAPTYLCIEGPEGDMTLALSDMALCDALTPAYFESVRDVLDGAAAVVADANLPRASLAYLARHVSAPLFVDPVSVTKAEKLRDLLPDIHTLKPNRLEAERLTGVPVTDRAGAAAAARALLARGVKRVLLSLGAEGALAAEGDEIRYCPSRVRTLRSATGAGDALMAALVWGHLRGEPFFTAAKLAMAAAAIAAESEETVSPLLSPEQVRARAEASV